MTQCPPTTESRWKTLCQTFPSQNAMKNGDVYHVTSGQSLGKTSKNLLFLSNDICVVTHLPADCGKNNVRTLCSKIDGKKRRPGNASLCIVSRDSSCQCTWTTSKLQGRNRIWICGKMREPLWISSHQRSGIKCTGDVPNANAFRPLILWMNTERCSNHIFPQV